MFDPRSGEILGADVQLYHNVHRRATKRHLRDVRDQVAMSLDPRAMRRSAIAAPVGAARGIGAGALADEPIASRDGVAVLRTTGPYDYDNDPFLMAPTSCWANVAVVP
ncbi:MAG: hypothetical protein ABI652_04510 [Acidobacteriota bacterium]